MSLFCKLSALIQFSRPAKYKIEKNLLKMKWNGLSLIFLKLKKQ